MQCGYFYADFTGKMTVIHTVHNRQKPSKIKALRQFSYSLFENGML